MMFNLDLKKQFATFYMFSLLLSGCEAQEKNIGLCKEKFREGKDYMNKYYSNKNTSTLDDALFCFNISMSCNETRLATIPLKVRVFLILKKFKSGMEFVDSLSATDFDISYGKEMNYRVFLANNYSLQHDTINEKQQYQIISKTIESFINNHKESMDSSLRVAYYDYFFVKHYFTKKDLINEEMDIVSKKYNNESEFFTALKNTINSIYDLPMY